jgi:hypothetical protein
MTRRYGEPRIGAGLLLRIRELSRASCNRMCLTRINAKMRRRHDHADQVLRLQMH